jgi:hypothetical protein
VVGLALGETEGLVGGTTWAVVKVDGWDWLGVDSELMTVELGA